MTTASQSLLRDLKGLVDSLTLTTVVGRRAGGGGGGFSVAAYVKRVKWVMQRPKVFTMRSSIESFKTTLILLVASMDSVEARQAMAPTGIL